MNSFVPILDSGVLYNGTYTIQNKETGEHRTFRIRTQKEDAKFAKGMRWISMLTGPDNGHSYTGFGFVTETSILVWKNKKEDKDPGARFSSWEKYAAMVWDLAANGGAKLGVKYTVMLSATCLRCNRELTHPESVRTRVGPVCAGRV